MLNPASTNDPQAPSDPAYAIEVPRATELLVVEVDPQVVNASPKKDFVPTFISPSGQVVTRTTLASDDFLPGSELMHISSPAQGTWMLRVHLLVHGDYMLRVRATALFHLHLTPLASAEALPSAGRAPLEVTFDAGATQLDAASATYCWKFTDDGTAAWGVRVTHTFMKVGTYDALLTVTDGQGFQGFNSAKVSVTS